MRPQPRIEFHRDADMEVTGWPVSTFGEAALPAVSVGGDQAARTWLARELHDSVVQTMTTTLVELEEWRRSELSTETRAQVHRHQQQVREALLGLREVVYGLRPVAHGEPALEVSIRRLVDGFEGDTGIHAAVTIGDRWTDDLPAPVRAHLRRVVEEALTNARIHSHAERVEVHLDRSAEGIEILISDDGRGRRRGAADALDGLGLRGMRERALLVGATLHVSDGASGGTVVHVCLPCARETS